MRAKSNTTIYSTLFLIVFFSATTSQADTTSQTDTATQADTTSQAEISAQDIVQQCSNKMPGKDLKSRLTIVLTNKSGANKRQEFIRRWKDSDGKDGIMSKTLLYTTYPPDNKGMSFLRWTYNPEVGKHDAQWLYLPQSRNLRKIPIQDLNNNFLNSDLTYGDMAPRSVDDDQHAIHDQDSNFYIVDSAPKEENSIYSKKRVWYSKGEGWSDCVRSRVEYYDLEGVLLKTQTIKWENLEGVWIWREMKVNNVQTKHSTLFSIDDVKLNTGLKDSLFTTRTLTRGLKDL